MQCPQCGAKGDFTLWESVNTDLNPSLKAKVISGELFQWTCPSCGHVWSVVYPMLYHDMTAKVLVEFRPTPPGQLRDTRSNPLYAAFERNGYTIRYAYTQEELSQIVGGNQASAHSAKRIFTKDDVEPSIGHSYVIDQNGEPMLTYLRPDIGIFCSTPLSSSDTPYLLNIRRPIIWDVNDISSVEIPRRLPSDCDGLILRNFGPSKITAFVVKDKTKQSMNFNKMMEL